MLKHSGLDRRHVEYKAPELLLYFISRRG